MSRLHQQYAEEWIVNFLRTRPNNAARRDVVLPLWTSAGRDEAWLMGAVSRLGLQDPNDPEIFRLVEFNEHATVLRTAP